MVLIDKTKLIKFLKERQKAEHDIHHHPSSWAEAYKEFIKIVEECDEVSVIEHIQGNLEEYENGRN